MFKADFLNEFVSRNHVQTVLELGCGDGQQLAKMKFPQYIGVDISRVAVTLCRNMYSDDGSKSFFHLSQRDEYFGERRFDLSLSLDVIYHLIEDHLFHSHMMDLFMCSRKYVIIYAWDREMTESEYRSIEYKYVHVKLRAFSKWVAENRPDWELMSKTDNPNGPPFFVFSKGA